MDECFYNIVRDFKHSYTSKLYILIASFIQNLPIPHIQNNVQVNMANDSHNGIEYFIKLLNHELI